MSLPRASCEKKQSFNFSIRNSKADKGTTTKNLYQLFRMMIAVPSYICDTQFKLNIFIYFYVLQIKFSKERKKDMKQQVPRLAWVQQTSHWMHWFSSLKDKAATPSYLSRHFILTSLPANNTPCPRGGHPGSCELLVNSRGPNWESVWDGKYNRALNYLGSCSYPSPLKNQKYQHRTNRREYT